MVSKPSTIPCLLGAMAWATTALPSYTASTADCIKAGQVELARQSSCGNRNALAECFSSLPSPAADNDGHVETVGALEWCFVSAGCSPSDANVEAFWTLRRCEPDVDPDLRRRERSAADLGVMLAMREPAIFEARQATTTTASSEPSPSVCYTTESVTVTACTTPNGAKMTQCGPTTMPSLKCAAGLICRTDNDGNPVCMFAETKIGTAGIFVGAYMVAAVVFGTAAVCFFCMRERRSQKRIERAAEAVAIAQETKNSSAAVRRATSGAGAPSVVLPSSEVSAPLMMSGHGVPRDPSPYHGRERNPFSETSNTLS